MSVATRGFKTVLKGMGGAHVALTVSSLAYGTFFGSSSSGGADAEHLDEAFDARHYQSVTKFVERVYSGNGAATSTTAAALKDGVTLADDVTFEDPAAMCCTKSEVVEAFRALQLAKPRCLSKPVCVDVEPKGGAIQLAYRLDQQYLNCLRVNSLLLLEVELIPFKGEIEMAHYSHFVIKKVEERWNGVPLLNLGYLHTLSRRINGLLSYYATTAFLPGSSAAAAAADNDRATTTSSKKKIIFFNVSSSSK